MAHLTDPELMQEAEETLLRTFIEFQGNVYRRLDEIDAQISELRCIITSGDTAEW